MPVQAHGGAPDELVAEILVLATIAIAWVGIARIRGKGFAWMPRGAGWALVILTPILLVTAVLLPTVIWPEHEPASERPTSTATLTIIQPTDGLRVSGPLLDVVTELSGARIVDDSATEVAPDTGHVHVFIDDQLMSMSYAPEQQIPIDSLGPGPHVLRVEFVAADHAAFDPPVEEQVTFVKLTG
jgi:hypothetical protein